MKGYNVKFNNSKFVFACVGKFQIVRIKATLLIRKQHQATVSDLTYSTSFPFPAGAVLPNQVLRTKYI